jgi:hypothetical protein
MIGKIGSMVLVAGIIANAAWIFLGTEKGEDCKKGEHQDGRFHNFPERILASNVPASW